MRKGWKKVELGSVLKQIIGGGTPSKKRPEYWDGDIPWCSVKDMSDGKFRINSTQDFITKVGLDNSSSKLIPSNTVVTSTRMGLGKVFMTGVPMSINQDLKALIPTEELDKVFLLYFIHFNRTQIEGLGTGATVKGIRLETLRSYPINLPPLPTQKKIAAILSAYDDLIENNLRRLKLLEEMAQQTYEEWFVRMKFPGHETAEWDEETGLPVGWERKKCFDCMDVLSGGTPKTSTQEYWNGNIPFYTPKDASDSTFCMRTEKHVTDFGLSKCNSKLYPENTVFITARGTVGKVNLAPKPMAMNQSCYALKGKMEISQFFLYSAISSIVRLFKSAANGGVFNTIVVDTFKYLPFIKPPRNLIDEFEAIAIKMFDSILCFELQNQHLKEARDLLLPRLMMGLIDVEAMEIV